MTLDKTFLRRSANPDVYQVKENDPQLNQAIEKAKLTIQYFKNSLEQHNPNQTYFSIKTKLTDGNHIEHIWLDAVEISDNIVYGIANNAPTNLRNIELGAKIGVSEADISDWLIIEENRLIGGYTIRAIRDKMSRPQRELFESTINFKIDHGKDFYEHNNLTPEGAILLIEDAYDAKDKDLLFSRIDWDANADIIIKNGPYAKFDGDTELHSQFIELLKTSLEKGLSESWPQFNNVDRAFIKKEFLPDDLLLITENIYHNDKLLSTNRLYVKKQSDGTYKFCGDAN